MKKKANKAKKQQNKYFIYILIGSTLLVMGGVGFYFFNGSKQNPDEAANKLLSKHANEHDKAGKNNHKDSDCWDDDAKETTDTATPSGSFYFLDPPFFRLPTFRIPVVKSGTIAAYVHLKVEMEGVSLSAFTVGKILLPRLVDRVFSDLYVALSTLWIPSEALKQEVIKERIFDVAASVLGKDMIRTVFIRQLCVDHVI